MKSISRSFKRSIAALPLCLCISAEAGEFETEKEANVVKEEATTEVADAGAEAKYGTVKLTRTDLTGIGIEKGVMRRDPSDVIKVGDLYYVWYSKGPIKPGYDEVLAILYRNIYGI